MMQTLRNKEKKALKGIRSPSINLANWLAMTTRRIWGAKEGERAKKKGFKGYESGGRMLDMWLRWLGYLLLLHSSSGSVDKTFLAIAIVYQPIVNEIEG
jgi:hypothetical protein